MQAIGAFFLALLLLTGPVLGAADAADLETRLQSWERAIERIDNRVRSGRTGTLEDNDLRTKLQEIADLAAKERDSAAKEAKQVRGLLGALGPKPGDDGEPEAETIRQRRQALDAELIAREGTVKETGLIVAKAEQVLAEIGRRSRERLKAALLEQTVSPLRYTAWSVASPEARRIAEASFVDAPRAGWSAIVSSSEKTSAVPRTLLLALVATAAGWWLGRWLRGRYGRVPGVTEPNYARRLLAGVAEGGGRALAPVVFVLLLWFSVVDGGLVTGTLETVTDAAARSLVLLFLGYALINAAFTPRRVEWRLMDFGEDATQQLVFRLRLALVVFLLLDGLHRATEWVTPSAELESVAALVFTLALTPVLISLLSRRIWMPSPDTPETETGGPRYPRLRSLMTLMLIALPVTALMGYPSLASHVTRAMAMTGLLLGGLGLLRSMVRESLAASLDPGRPLGRRVTEVLALGDEGRIRLLFLLYVLSDLALLVLTGIALLPVWGLGAEETAASVAKLARGVQVGSYTLSPIDIFVGLALFAAIVLVTRLLQKGLERHILPNLTKDKGVRDALKTGVGYLGVVIAGLVAISALGLDLTNLALIAGALSVGLGFGLQNVVNNFVSGLILLAERPIKPGDWVVIGSHEGTVKKVNVRSTEVETFQKASVILPNADLISNPVINWTHKNIQGRVEVIVGVAYGSDPRTVEQVLLDCARAHSNVIEKPAPFVLFQDFGDSALIFELRAFLGNVEKRLRTASDLRFAIHEALKGKGIEIPFPQRVVHMAPLQAPPPDQESAQ